MLKYTNYTLKKFEAIFEELQYTIRYEKGNFQSGYCIVENKKIAVINKFFDVEARINSLLDILATVQVDPDTLDEKEAKLYLDLRKDDYLSTSESEAPSN